MSLFKRNPQPVSPTLSFISALFVTILIISNIIAGKVGDFFGFFLPVAVIVFPLSYIIGDVLTEVYGYAAARRVIWMGFLCNLLAVFFIWLGQIIPAASFFEGQAAYLQILGATPRFLLASFVAYLLGEFSNSFILAKLKISTKGKHLWLRTISSTIIGQGLDSAVFITLAFWGIFEPAQIGTLILTQWIFKTLFEIIATPFTYLAVRRLKKLENKDTYDHKTNFNPFDFD